MNYKGKYLLIAFVLLSFVLMAIPALAANIKSGTGETRGVCSNPIGDTIDKTASIKEMQSKPARGMCCRVDVLDNKVPTQTDNSGRRSAIPQSAKAVK